MTDFILKILDGCKGLFRLMKVDYEKFRILMWVKLTIDNRQEKSVAQRTGKKEISQSMRTVMLIYAFMGIFIGLVLLGIQSVFVSMVFVFAAIMVMTAVALISDFSSVLLDTTDNAILLPRPIDSRTLGVSRIFHIVVYLLMITLSLSLFTIILGTIRLGPLFTVSFILALILSVLFIVFLSNVFYFLLLKLSGEEQLRDIILYFQIFMAALAMGSYQLLPRLVRMEAMRNFTIPIEWWTYLVPPAWMAALVDMSVTGKWGGSKLIMFLIGFFISLLSAYVVIKFLAPGFSQAIARLGIAGSADGQLEESAGKPGWMGQLARLFTSSAEERGSFQFFWRIMSRDRKFKLKTYPVFGYMMIIAAVMTFLGDDDMMESIVSLPSTQKYLIFLYIGCILLPSVLSAQRFSDQYEAAWIYHTLPFSSPGHILMGSLKAALVKFGFSILSFLGLLVILIWGFHTLDDILLAAANMMLNSLLVAFLIRGDLPFSTKYGPAKDAHKGLIGFALFLIPLTLGLIHWGLTFLPYGVPAGIAASLIISLTALKIYGNTSWAKVS
jgi:hypothetical protein